jgi:hypothetical protein
MRDLVVYTGHLVLLWYLNEGGCDGLYITSRGKTNAFRRLVERSLTKPQFGERNGDVK